MGVDEAYNRCLRDARGHYENFPVASVLVPARMRRHVAALYAFARAADDFADEPGPSPAERLTLLDGWRRRLHEAVEPSAGCRPPVPGEPAHTAAIFLALGTTVRQLHLPVQYLEDLLSAFEQDVRVTRYESWDDLLDYCRRSANPIGRLVLRIGGQADPQLDAWSDSLCTALQLTNFWQDAREDMVRGRAYLPQELQRRHGAQGQDSWGGPGWRAALAEAVSRTRALYAEARPLSAALPGRLRYEIRATWLGGVRILDKIERAGFDVVGRRHRLGALDAAWICARLAR